MQHKQQNYKAWICGAVLAAAGLFTGLPGHAAGIANPAKADPILTGGSAGPCDPQKDGADYVGGTDVNGQPVTSADLDKAPVPVPGQIQVPVRSRRGTSYVQADGKALGPLLNPPPGCAGR